MTGGARGRVTRFGRALALALFDYELERQGRRIRFYFDADVIFKMIMGLEAELSTPTERDADLLLRALLSCGFLGPVYMLKPHAFELGEKLRRQGMFSRKRDQDEFLARASNFLATRGILDVMSRLHAAISGNGDSPPLDDSVRVERFLDILRVSPGRIFGHIEQTYGTWWERLHRYQQNGLLRLDRLGQDIDSLLVKHEPQLRSINAILRRRRPEYTINVFQDAIALTILHDWITAAEGDNSDEVVRFYTETLALREDIRSDRTLRDLLSYRMPVEPSDDMLADAQLALRDSRYFIMRAWVSQLAASDATEGRHTIKDLQALSSDIGKILELPEGHLEQAIERIELDGKTLNVLIDAFEKLAVTDYVWTSGGIPEDLKSLQFLRRWTRVFEFAERNTTDRIVFERIEDVLGQLSRSVSRVGRWKTDFARVLWLSERTRSRAKGRIRDAMRDLGLVRWGYRLDQTEADRLAATLEALLQEEDIAVEAARVALLLDESRRNELSCGFMCAILWAIGGLADIVTLVQQCRALSEKQRLGASLEVIGAAAEIRVGGLIDYDQRRTIVERVWNLQSALSARERVEILLGVAYVLYQAWKQEWIASDLGVHEIRDMGADAQQCAQRSFALGEEAYRVLPRNGLASAFAVNHCAYVGVVADLEPTKTDRYLQTLIRLEPFPSLWNARFSDTVGTYYLTAAERAWYGASEEQRRSLDLSRSLRKAEQYLAKAEAADIGDTDVQEHLNRLEMIQNSYGQVTGPQSSR